MGVAVKVTCPCCNGAGEIEPEAPVRLTPLQFKIYDIVRKSKHGILGPDLVRKVYADRADGGPDWASTSIHVQIKNMNGRLAVVGQMVRSDTRGVGGRFWLRHVV